MIWLIAKKDFLLNLLSVRFIIGDTVHGDRQCGELSEPGACL